MLKRRIIPVELLHGGRLVKSVRFDAFRDVGDPVKSSQVYANQDADELVLLNVDRAARSVDDTAAFLRRIAETCFMPITAGGGIASIEDAATLFAVGADKVAVNSAAFADHQLLSEVVRRYGGQALVVSVDVRRDERQHWGVYADCGRQAQRIGLEDHLAAMADLGAGEILINSIDCDGTMTGYDLDLLHAVRKACRLPLIVCGGAGNYAHLLEAFEGGADAVACGSLFNFGDNNPLRVKSFLKNHGVPLKRI